MQTHIFYPLLKGLIAAPFTAFHQDGTINKETIANQCQSLVRDGVIGAFICGTTGEGLSLTIQERMTITEIWMAVAPTDFKIIVHVGHNSLGEAQQLAAHAADIQAFGIGGFSPFFFKIHTPELLAEVCAQISSKAPELPFFYYHIPSLTGVQMHMRDFLEAAHARIPNLAGIKYSHGDLMDLRLCREFAEGRYQVMFGADEILLSAMVLGVVGAVGSTYNYASPLYNKMISAFEAGNLSNAHTYQMICMKMVEVIHRYGNGTTVGKVISQHLGLDCGPCRLPLQTLSSQQRDAVIFELSEIGFWQALEAAKSSII